MGKLKNYRASSKPKKAPKKKATKKKEAKGE